MKILLLGGNGFLGRAVSAKLKSHEVWTLGRSSGGERHIQGDITSMADLEYALGGVDVVINCVGLSPLRKPAISYETIHVDAVRCLIEACRTSLVKKVIHVSAVGADKTSDIAYVRTKGLAEDLLLGSGLDVFIVRPSLVYDEDNEFIRQVRALAWTCVFPNIPALMQPVYRDDVAELMRLIVDGKVSEPVVNAVGRDTLTIFQMARMIMDAKGFPCFPIPFWLFKPVMQLIAWCQVLPIGPDQVKAMCIRRTATTNMIGSYLPLTSFEAWLGENKKGFVS